MHEKADLDKLLVEDKVRIENKDDAVIGFNIGINCEKDAG